MQHYSVTNQRHSYAHDPPMTIYFKMGKNPNIEVSSCCYAHAYWLNCYKDPIKIMYQNCPSGHTGLPLITHPEGRDKHRMCPSVHKFLKTTSQVYKYRAHIYILSFDKLILRFQKSRVRGRGRQRCQKLEPASHDHEVAPLHISSSNVCIYERSMY